MQTWNEALRFEPDGEFVLFKVWETHTLGVKDLLGAVAVHLPPPQHTPTEASWLPLVSLKKHAAHLARRTASAGRHADDLGQLCVRVAASEASVHSANNDPSTPRSANTSDCASELQEPPALARVLTEEETAASEARALFGGAIPEGEPLYADFSCALKQTILVHGRLFVFQRHVAFSANLFAVLTSTVIPLAEVQSVRTLTRPLQMVFEAIELRTRERSYVFASFLQCAGAFHAIQSALSAVKKERGADIEPLVEEEAEGVEETVLAPGPVARCVLNKMEGFEVSEAMPAVPAESVELQLPRALLPCRPEAAFALFFAEGSHFTETFRTAHGDWDVEVGPWTEWEQVLGPGRVRDIRFVAPTNTSFPRAPKATHVNETQRFRFFVGTAGSKTVVLESSTQMLDIPFGDRFSLETRMVLSPVAAPDGSAQCHMRVSFRTVWHKTCTGACAMVKGKVEKDSKAANEQAFTLMHELMSHFLSNASTGRLLSGEPAPQRVAKTPTPPTLKEALTQAVPQRSEGLASVLTRDRVWKSATFPLLLLLLFVVGLVAFRLGRRSGSNDVR